MKPKLQKGASKYARNNEVLLLAYREKKSQKKKCFTTVHIWEDSEQNDYNKKRGYTNKGRKNSNCSWIQRTKGRRRHVRHDAILILGWKKNHKILEKSRFLHFLPNDSECLHIISTQYRRQNKTRIYYWCYPGDNYRMVGTKEDSTRHTISGNFNKCVPHTYTETEKGLQQKEWWPKEKITHSLQ